MSSGMFQTNCRQYQPNRLREEAEEEDRGACDVSSVGWFHGKAWERAVDQGGLVEAIMQVQRLRYTFRRIVVGQSTLVHDLLRIQVEILEIRCHSPWRLGCVLDAFNALSINTDVQRRLCCGDGIASCHV